MERQKIPSEDRRTALLKAFDSMSDTGRDYFFGMARQLLRSFPRQEGSYLLPAAEQADKVQLLNDEANCTVYQFPLLGASKPVDRKKADLG